MDYLGGSCVYGEWHYRRWERRCRHIGGDVKMRPRKRMPEPGASRSQKRQEGSFLEQQREHDSADTSVLNLHLQN